MISFIFPLVLSVMFATLTIMFLIIAFIKSKKSDPNIYVIIASLFSAFGALISAFNIIVPKPTIFPLDNETKIYSEEVKIAISSDDVFEKYYSLNGYDPKDGKIYENEFTISESTTICARNKFLFWWSDITKTSYQFEEETSSAVYLDDDNSIENAKDETNVPNGSEQQDKLNSPLESEQNQNPEEKDVEYYDNSYIPYENMISEETGIQHNDDDILNENEDNNANKVSVFTLDTFQGIGGWYDRSHVTLNNSDFFDVYGNEYLTGRVGTHNISSLDNKFIPVYLLGGKYSSCEGEFAWPKNRKDPEGKIWIEFYSDDNLIYQTDPITENDGPLNFEFSVVGVEKLTIIRNSTINKVRAIYSYLNLIP